MKKIFTKILIISIICLLASMIMCYFSAIFIGTTAMENDVEKSIYRQKLDILNAEWKIPSSGNAIELHSYILTIPILALETGFETFENGILIFMLIAVIPIIILGIITILQIIARSIQIGKEQEWKNLTSRMITIISIIIQIMLCLEIVISIIVVAKKTIIGILALMLILCLNVLVVEKIISELIKEKNYKDIDEKNIKEKEIEKESIEQ